MKQNALNYKDKAAVIFEGNATTYEQLNIRANQLANAISERGFNKGDKIAVLMKNNAAYIEIIVGLAKIGVIIVPINYRSVDSEIDYIIRHSDSKGLILTEEYVEVVNEILPDLTQLDTIVTIGNQTNDRMIDYKNFIDEGLKTEPDVQINEEDPFYMGYTSGTTGKPKGVVITHRSRVLTGMVAAYEYKIGESDTHFVGGPIYHAAPWIFVLMQLIVGGTLVIHETFRAEKALADMSKYHVTNTFLTPTMYSFLVDAQAEATDKFDIASLRVLISAGAPLPTSTKEELFNFAPTADLYEFYGSTESAITLNIKPADIHSKEQSIGHPFPLVECMILDGDKNPVAQGVIGELYFKSAYIMDHYYKNPEETDASFHGEFFTVGDLAMQDEEGFYYIVDRKKDMLISGGVNIYPREIEDVLHTHPLIKDVAIIGVPDSVWGESVKAIVVSKNEDELTEKEVMDYCEGKIAGYKKPKSVNFVKELPRNPSGKVLKTDLRNHYK